jgi:hypothetical protein
MLCALNILLYVSGGGLSGQVATQGVSGGGSSCQVATQGLSFEPTLQAFQMLVLV